MVSYGTIMCEMVQCYQSCHLHVYLPTFALVVVVVRGVSIKDYNTAGVKGQIPCLGTVQYSGMEIHSGEMGKNC